TASGEHAAMNKARPEFLKTWQETHRDVTLLLQKEQESEAEAAAPSPSEKTLPRQFEEAGQALRQLRNLGEENLQQAREHVKEAQQKFSELLESHEPPVERARKNLQQIEKHL